MTEAAHRGIVMRVLETQEAESEYFYGEDFLSPGREGYWQVWGSRPMDIRPGDLVMAGYRDRETDTNVIDEYVVGPLVPWDEPQKLMNSLRVRFRDLATDELRSVGMMQPTFIWRWGTHATLGDYVR